MLVAVAVMLVWHLLLLGSDAVWHCSSYVCGSCEEVSSRTLCKRSAVDRSKLLALTAVAYVYIHLQVAAMKDASKTLKAEVKKIDINKVEDLTDDMADMMEDMNEINDIMGRSYK